MKGGGKGRLWSWIVALPLAAILLWWSLRGVDWKTVWATIAGGALALSGVRQSLHLFFLFPARHALAHPAERRRESAGGGSVLRHHGGLHGQRVSAGARRRSDPYAGGQRPIEVDEGIRPHHGAQRAPDGRDRAGAMGLASSFWAYIRSPDGWPGRPAPWLWPRPQAP